MLGLAFAGMLGAAVSVTAMSGAVVPLHGTAFELASVAFLLSALASTLGLAAADG